jgi:mannose-6-phosphate isomerase-like protein (cupin superfamily)
MREGVPVENGTLRAWWQIGRDTGAQAISLRVLEFAPGVSPHLRNDACDELLYVLEGAEASAPVGLMNNQQEVSRQERMTQKATIIIDGRSFEVTPQSGIYLRPEETLQVENPGPDPLVLISSQCPEPENSHLNRAAQLAAQARDTLRIAPPSRSTASPIVRLQDRPEQPTADRWYRVLVDDEVGSARATQFVGSIPPGRAPDHFHQYEEVLFILRGEGRMWAGESHTAIAAGSCIYLPRGQVHCVENTGANELRLLGIFYPAGSPSVRYDV